MTRLFTRLDLLAAAAFAFVAIAGPAHAVGTETPPAPADAKKPDDKAKADEKAKPTDAKPAETKPEEKAPEKKSEREFRDGYKTAYDMIYKQKNYADAIVVLTGLGYPDHPDVANLIGFSSRKLGRSDDAKVWYEKALAADPKHTRTWQYYGMWHLEQGNRLKAEDHLERIRLICGQGCDDYKSLQDALNGNATY